MTDDREFLAWQCLALLTRARTLISGKGNESGRAIDTATNTGQYL